MEREQIETLLVDSNRADPLVVGQLLRAYQSYLTVLAAAQMNRKLRGRLNPSDLVQETMLAAHRDFPKFRGRSEPEFVAWLRQVFIRCLHHAIDLHIHAKKRDIRCEVSLDQVRASVDQSAVNLGNMLADKGPSPSSTYRQRERAVELADQLARLKPEYRDVIVLRNLQGLSFDEVAEQMQRKPATVRMLWLRAIEKLKHAYTVDDGS